MLALSHWVIRSCWLLEAVCCLRKKICRFILQWQMVWLINVATTLTVSQSWQLVLHGSSIDKVHALLYIHVPITTSPSFFWAPKKTTSHRPFQMSMVCEDSLVRGKFSPLQYHRRRSDLLKRLPLKTWRRSRRHKHLAISLSILVQLKTLQDLFSHSLQMPLSFPQM